MGGALQQDGPGRRRSWPEAGREGRRPPGSQQGLPLAEWSWKLTNRGAQGTWPVWPWTSLLIPLSLSFFTCERGHHPDWQVCGNGWR